MTTLRWLYCYSCLFDRTLVALQWDMTKEWGVCPICNRVGVTGEVLYYLLLGSSRQ